MPRILIIDDEIPIQKALTGLLEQEGYEVKTASEGSEGIKACETGHFDLVITDVIMPGKEGIETILELSRKLPGLKIIAMSGGGKLEPDGYLNVAKKMGADLTITKPFTSDEVLAAVRDLLDRRYIPNRVE